MMPPPVVFSAEPRWTGYWVEPCLLLGFRVMVNQPRLDPGPPLCRSVAWCSSRSAAQCLADHLTNADFLARSAAALEDMVDGSDGPTRRLSEEVYDEGSRFTSSRAAL